MSVHIPIEMLTRYEFLMVYEILLIYDSNDRFKCFSANLCKDSIYLGSENMFFVTSVILKMILLKWFSVFGIFRFL